MFGPIAPTSLAAPGRMLLDAAAEKENAAIEAARKALAAYVGIPGLSPAMKKALTEAIGPLLVPLAQCRDGRLDLSNCAPVTIGSLPPALIEVLAPRVRDLSLPCLPPRWVKDLPELVDLTLSKSAGKQPVLDLTKANLGPRLERVHILDASRLQTVRVRQGMLVDCEQPQGANQKISVEHYDDSGRRLYKGTAASNRPYWARKITHNNFNGVAKFADGTEIFCDTLSAYWMRRRAEWRRETAEKGLTSKLDTANVAGSPSVIAKSVQAGDRTMSAKLDFEALENIGCQNSEIGRAFSYLFRKMLGKGCSTLFAQLRTRFPMKDDEKRENHGMTVELNIKLLNGKPVFGLVIYDPNDTDNYERIVAYGLKQVEQWQVADLIDPEKMEVYYHNTDFSSLLVKPDASYAMDARAMAFFFNDEKPVSPRILFQAFLLILTTGLADAMPTLKKHIAALSEPCSMLTARVYDGRQTVRLAIELGTPQVITALGDMLEQLGKDSRLTKPEIAELWMGPGDIPSLASACLRNDAGVIAAVGAGTKKLAEAELLSRDQVFQWLTASTAEGVRCLAQVFNSGRPETIAAAGDMVVQLREAGLLSYEQAEEAWKAEATELWKTNTDEGWTGMEAVSLRGDPEVIAAYEAVRKQLERRA